MAHILVIDDEPQIGALLEALLGERGHSCLWVASGEEGIAQLSQQPRPDVVLLDRMLGSMDGFEALAQFRRMAPKLPVLVMTAFGGVETAVVAMRLGAVDFVEKPFENDKLIGAVESALSRRCPQTPLAPTPTADGRPSLVGESFCFREALSLAQRFAVPNINVLLVGETGTGKEMFAQAIHAASKRCDGPFVPLDCSALPESLIESELFGHQKGAFTGATTNRIGRLEMAEGGTLFLDEVGNLPASIQPKLLRVLQSRCLTRVGGRDVIRLDIRLIAATNTHLKEVVDQGTFRQDLYYRIAEVTIVVPPLRGRDGDVVRIAEFQLGFYARRFGVPVPGLSRAAADLLNAYQWPGNVRELENVIKRAVVLAGPVVLPEHLPPEVASARTSRPDGYGRPSPAVASDGGLRVAVDLGISAKQLDLKTVGHLASEMAEKAFLKALIDKTGNTAGQLANLLGVDRKTLRAKLKKYGLELGARRPEQ